MLFSVILAHPDPASFNHAIANQVIQSLQATNHDVRFHDLYKEQFDPLLTTDEISRNCDLPPLVQQHCAEIVEADSIIIIHPNWWGQPPAILKGWIDRVLRPGVTYEFNENDDGGEGIPNGLLKAQSALVFNTSNTPTNREKELFLDPLETLWKNCIFHFCGTTCFYRRMFNVVVTSTQSDRSQWLKEVDQYITDHF